MGRTILVADDSPTVQKKASGILTGEGLDVVTVSNGVAAVKKLPSVNPLVVLADVVEAAAGALDSSGDARSRALRRFIQGDLASLRVVVGLAVIWLVFQTQNDRFLSAQNLTNLMLQITAVGLISIGIVFVLLLGEIDLSAAFAGGVCAAVMVRLMVGYDLSWAVTIGAALITGMAIGLLIGLLVALAQYYAVSPFIYTLF